jgi:hypothetical protein
VRPGDIRWSGHRREPVSDAVLLKIDKFGQRLQRRGAVQGAVRPVLIVVGLVLAQESAADGPGSRRGHGSGTRGSIPRPSVQRSRSCGAPGHYRARSGSRHRRGRVECRREVRAAVADHELDLVRLTAEVHDQVADLLGGLSPGWMRGGSEDADAPGGVLDHGQDIGSGAAGQAGREEAACQDRVGLGAQELRPDRPGSAQRGLDSGLPAGFSHYRCRYPSVPGRPARRGSCGPPIRDSRGPAGGSVPPDVPAGRRPVLPCTHLAGQRRRTMSQCQRRIV